MATQAIAITSYKACSQSSSLDSAFVEYHISLRNSTYYFPTIENAIRYQVYYANHQY
jgi:hypothetical protein